MDAPIMHFEIMGGKGTDPAGNVTGLFLAGR